MIYKTFLFFSFILSFPVYSQLAYLPDYSWGGSFGDAEFDYANKVTTDIYGDAIVTGKFIGLVDFDLTASSTNLGSAGQPAISLAKYSPDGSLKWVKKIQSNPTSDNSPHIKSIATDSSGNIYLVGYFYGVVDFDPSPTATKMLAAVGEIGAFIVKLDRNGILVWAGSIGSDLSTFSANGVAVDSQDNVYITGGFSGDGDFDITSGVFNMASGNGQATFILKLNKDSQLIWGKITQGIGGDSGISVAVDSASNVFITGTNSGTNDFDPSPGGTFNITTLTSGQVYLLKLDSNGNFVNAGVVSASVQSHRSRSTQVKIDGNNNVIIAGYFSGTLDFDFGTSVNQMTQSGNVPVYDAFVLKVDNNLNYLWAAKLGAEFADGINGLAIDQNDNILSTGFFEGIIVNDYTGRDGSEIFIWALSPAGNQIDLEDYVGPTNIDKGNDIAVDKSGNVYLVGEFMASLKDMTIFDYQSVGMLDGFVVKLGNAPVQQPANIPPTAINDTFTADGNSSSIHNVLANDLGLSGTNIVKIVSQPLHGTVSINAAGMVTYTPTASAWGTDSFSYTVENGNGLVSNVAVVNLTNANLGTEEIASDHELKLYPNPAVNVVSISSALKITSIEVFEISGKKIFSVKNVHSIDVSSLISGMYVLIAETNDGKRFKKTFIKK
ncbi:Ig-like domain-containing protein [Chryseobacterium cheonjiense]|uniref:T9SS type A sorting domain-containing protein n=1 Tax=Chryseobacterium cheonjiense TaxID=2728845 RepID=A0A7Y0A6C4_9FLAO|nr:Ig-like domain-containing protein [Chryseobacterium cheonjiense]NML57516.1 T9SS type A sorting domain-containing protein [Chryseobacterium cheonjiense]